MGEGLLVGSMVGSVIAHLRRRFAAKRWQAIADQVETRPRFAEALDLDNSGKDCKFQSAIALGLAVMGLIAGLVWR